MNQIIIKQAQMDMAPALKDLHHKVSRLSGGIIRYDDEINDAYIHHFLEKSLKNGISLVAVDFETQKIVGEIHAYTLSLIAFRHMLSELTIIVDPDYQGQGIGKRLFTEFFNIVDADFSHIHRIELYVRNFNDKAIRFYEKLGFINEGPQKNKILTKDGVLETPLHMAWFNPKYRHNYWE